MSKKILKLDDDNTIKVKLTEKQQTEIGNLIIDEIEQIDSDRSDKLTEWCKAREMYNLIPEEPNKDFPWEHCANIVFPLVAWHTDGILARLKKTKFDQRPLWFADNYNAETTDIAKWRERFTDFSARNEIKLKESSELSLFETVLLGTGVGRLINKRNIVRNFVEQDFHKDSKFKDYKENDNYAQIKKITGKKTVRGLVEETQIEQKLSFDYIQLERFYCPKNITIENLDDARIVGHSYDLRWPEVIMRKKVSGWYNIDKIEKYLAQDKIDKWKEKLEFVDVILQYDVDDDNETEKVVCTVEKNSRTLVQSIYFPYHHNSCFYHIFNLKRRESGIYGMGTYNMLKELNDMISIGLNQSYDSITIRNIPTFVKKRGGDKEFDPFSDNWYPGKIWEVNDIHNDIMPYYIPGNSSESLNLTNIIQQVAERRSGFSQYMSGKESVTDPSAPASKTIALLSESLINISEYADNLAVTWDRIGFQIDKLNKQFVKQERTFYYDERDKKGINKLSISNKDIKNFKPEIALISQGSSVAINKIIERMEIMELYKILKNDKFIMSNPEADRYLTDLFIHSYSVGWEKHAWNLLPSKEELQETRPEVSAMVLKKFIQTLKTRGATDEQVADLVSQKVAEIMGKKPQITPVEMLVGGQQQEFTGNTNSVIPTTAMPERVYKSQKAKIGM